MLASPELPSLHLHPFRNSRSSPAPRRFFLVASAVSSDHGSQSRYNKENLPSTNQNNRRTHNSRSLSLLHRYFSHHPSAEESLTHPISPEEKARFLEMSLVTKRNPQFPFSLNPQSPTGSDGASSFPPLKMLFQGIGDDVDDEEEREMIVRAVEIRRKVTAEILKEAMMRKGKFGITYSNNLVACVPGFVDYVMVEAALLKRVPEFSDSNFNVRAKTIIQDSGVVPLIRWLKHNALSYPQIGSLIHMSKGNLESIRCRAEWLKSINVRGRYIGVVFKKAGGYFLERTNEELEEIVEYLEKNGVRKEWMGCVMRQSPQLLSFSLEEVKSRVNFYVNMGINEKDFGTMVFDYPGVLGHLTLEEMNQKLDYLKEFGLSKEELGRVLAFRPQLMSCSIEERWKPLVKYLYYLGIPRDGMRRMLKLKPMVFCFDLEITIVPKVRFFKDIGIRDDAIGGMLVKFPSLLTYSLYKKIRPVVIFLMTRAGVSEKDIGKVIALGPELLGCSIAHKLDVNVKYFLSLGIKLHQLGEMIADFPMLLRYNVDVLRPKYIYLRRTMARPLQDLIEFPRFFSYSLDGRIIPRHKIMVENRINFQLRYMLGCTDEDFNQRIEAAMEKRRRFESGLASQPLHSSVTGDRSSEKELLVNSIEGEITLHDSRRSGSSAEMIEMASSGNEDTENLILC